MAALPVAGWGGPDAPFQLDTRVPILHRAGQSFSAGRLWEHAGSHLGFYG